MTRRISLIIGVAVVALTVAVPAAFGEGRLAGSQEPVVAVSPDAFERAVLAKQHDATSVTTYPDAFERAVVASQSESPLLTSLAAREKALGRDFQLGDFAVNNEWQNAQGSVPSTTPQWLKALEARSEGLNKKYGLGEYASTSTVARYADAHAQTVTASPRESLGRGLSDFGQSFSQIAVPLQQSTVDGYVDAHERAVPPTGSDPVSITSTGRDIEWPQIGVGFGIGIVLVLGLILGLKATRNPPLAH